MTARMSVEELQVRDLAMNGPVRRSSFVFFSYSFKELEATKMVRNLEEAKGVGSV